MEQISSRLLKMIDRGRLGKNHGIPMGLPKLEGIIDGNSRATYTLIISNSGAGKTSLALYSYVYKPLMETMDNPDNFKILYFSLEMSEESLYLKLLSTYIFETYGITLSYKEIISQKKEYILSDEHYDLVNKCMPWVDKISKRLEIYDKRTSAKSAYAILKQRLEKMGKFVETDTRTIYVPDNPDLIYNVVIDHIGLIYPTDGRKLKEEIDTLSSYLVTLREKCGISPIVIQQANRDQGNIERFKAGKSAFTINDAKDSGNTVQDANVMIAIYNPFRDKLNNYQGYNIKLLQSRFRSIMVLKDRFGATDVEVGCTFYGEINMWSELPKPDEIYDYERYEDPNYILGTTAPDSQIEEDTPSNLNFIV